MPDDDTKPHLTAPSPRVGLACGLGAYTLWGVIPLYFRMLSNAPAMLILGHRIVWSVVFLGLLIVLQRRAGTVLPLLRSPRILLLLVGSTVMIAGNWFAFIWAVERGRVMEASLGYFITPFVNVALGMLFLRERLRPWQAVALAVAAVGVVTLTAHRGHVPYVAVALAGSFGVYGLLRKLTHVEPIVGIFVETVLLLPLGLFVVATAAQRGTHPTDGLTLTLLVLLGVVSSVPLLLFATAARALRLTTVGFLQYLGPTLQFFVAVLIFREPFGRAEAITFACIWAGLAVYSADAYRAFRTAARAVPTAPRPPAPAPAAAADPVMDL